MKKTIDIEVKCKCGEVIPNSYIDYYNGCNEEGEEYGEVSAWCPDCKKEFESWQWGEWDNEEEAIKTIIEYIHS